jgi:hypothetical protein
MTKTTIVCDWCTAENPKVYEALYGIEAHVCEACAQRPDVAKVVILARGAAIRAGRPGWANQPQGMTNAQLANAGKYR